MKLDMNLKLQDTRVEIGLLWNTASPTTYEDENSNQQFIRSPNLKADLSNHFIFEFLCFQVTVLCFECLTFGSGTLLVECQLTLTSCNLDKFSAFLSRNLTKTCNSNKFEVARDIVKKNL
ncbi:hypothetical protein Avbf_04471 [Armadillidium vulgare]|nr:hypothetical protein Avbf_04471 [Armadillidium vulgare]